jgi:hypothetical protein
MRTTTGTNRRYLAAAALLAFAGQSSAQLPAPQYVVILDETRTGSILRREQGEGFPLPVASNYEQLTPEQKTIVHSWYEHIEPGDEPPYPAEGLAVLIDAIREGQEKLQVRGELELAGTVGPAGNVTKVEVLKSPNWDMGQFAGTVFLMTRFKPAICKGRPCQMQFPLSLRFDITHEEDRIRVVVPIDRDP